MPRRLQSFFTGLAAMPSGECSGSRRNRFRTRTPLLYNGRMKFSIRDVLWLTVVVALVVGWGLDRVQLRQAEVKARRAELSARMAAEQTLYASKLAQAHAEMARAAEAQLRTTTTP